MGSGNVNEMCGGIEGFRNATVCKLTQALSLYRKVK